MIKIYNITFTHHFETVSMLHARGNSHPWLCLLWLYGVVAKTYLQGKIIIHNVSALARYNEKDKSYNLMPINTNNYYYLSYYTLLPELCALVN